MSIQYTVPGFEPSERESLPITTRPGLPPLVFKCLIFHQIRRRLVILLFSFTSPHTIFLFHFQVRNAIEVLSEESILQFQKVDIFKQIIIPGIFFFIFAISSQLTVSKCLIKISDDRNQTWVLWFQKRPLCHNDKMLIVIV